VSKVVGFAVKKTWMEHVAIDGTRIGPTLLIYDVIPKRSSCLNTSWFMLSGRYRYTTKAAERQIDRVAPILVAKR